ncbi:MAG: restriction modification system DNA specificity domain-containing protein [Parcubacteria group bacterium Gr01-1014_46]|nr:MAG: restriction modification system DNA specificity domain-containing protein [Parcubacteria group bacterium Gr01-1014_46]
MNPNWQTKKLGDLYDITSSKRVFKSEWKRNGVPFYRAREIVKLAKQGYVNNDLFISDEMYKKYSEKYGAPKEGDIMVTGVGTLGICYVVKKDDKFYFKDGNIIWLRTKNEADSRLIEYAFKSDVFKKQINDGKGATVGTYTIIKAKNTSIPLPSLDEQKRIANKLDEVSEKVTKAKDNAEKNLQNSKELFELYLQSVFSNPGKNWEETKLGDAYDVRDGTHDSPRYQKEGFALITSKNLKRDLLNFNKVKYISEKDYKKINDRSKVDKEDILFAMIGTIGNPVVVEVEPNFAIKNVALFKIPKEQSAYFLKYFLDSRFVIDKMMSEAKGTTQKFVGLGYLRSFKIKLPPLVEQKTIVKKLEILSLETRKLEKIYEQKLSDLEELKKSILSKAFHAEL